MTEESELYLKIKKLADNQKMSMLTLNDRAKLGTNAIYRWRTQTPGTDKIKKVADVLGVSVDYLLGNTDEMTPNKKSPEDYSSDELIKEFNRRIQNNEMAVGTSINEDNLDDEAMENIKKYIKEQSMLAVLREEQRRGMK